MDVFLFHPVSDSSMEINWGKMIFLSLVLHLTVFFTLLFIPEAMPTRQIRETVYEVKLVEMPRGKRTSVQSQGKAKTEKRLATSVKKTSSAKRLSRRKSKAKAVTIAKRTVKTKKISRAKKIKVEDSDAKYLDQAISKIKRETKEEKIHVKKEVVSGKETAEGSGRHASGRAENGISIHLYKLAVEERIKDKWSYPLALLGPNSKKNPFAVVELKVHKNGSILRSRVIRSSGNAKFDQSVLMAIKRSDPLPSFPESYRKTDEEIEINFNLSDLKNF